MTKLRDGDGFPIREFMIKSALGDYSNIATENKFGRSTNVDTVSTDIWDLANATDDQAIWIAPTAARVHAIVSTDTDDQGGSPLGTGARTIRVYGLTDWDTKEVSEVIQMNGTTPVNTVNSYVIIYRMEASLWGSTGPNAGKITATTVGQSPSTITACMLLGAGQTQMAVYGVPSAQIAVVPQFYFSVNRQTAAVRPDCCLLVNPIPHIELTKFLTKHPFGLSDVATNAYRHKYNPYKAFPGPCILKMNAISSALNADVSAGFDAYLVDK